MLKKKAPLQYLDRENKLYIQYFWCVLSFNKAGKDTVYGAMLISKV